MSDANKQLSAKFTELFSTGDEDAADRIMSQDVVFHHATANGPLRGRDAFKGFLAAYRRAFPSAHSTVEAQVAEGDTVVTRWRARGTHDGPLGPIPATGRDFETHGITIERIEDGQIAEVWVARDELGLLRQLGVAPAAEA
ncbi:MAG TPA: ester cyclase [Thermoleophilaceae bacterium]|nr:ester cyclase [Thermoleophilaceae bacterium]